MVLVEVYERFVKRAPICVRARAVLERALSPALIHPLFDPMAERQYTRTLLFSTGVDRMGLVVCRARPSVHAAYQACAERREGLLRSLYEKIARRETGVSEAWVRHSALEWLPVIEALGAEGPTGVPGDRRKILDGNPLAGAEHRLQPLRPTRAGALPGQARVVLDPQVMRACQVVRGEDGHAQERSMTERVRALAQAGDVGGAERNFCPTAFLFGFAHRQAGFVIRPPASTLKILFLGEAVAKGRTDTGTLFEQAMTLQDAQDERLEVRRITVVLDTPTRDGDSEIHRRTSLPETVLSADPVAKWYRRRGAVETAFPESEATLAGEINTLGSPKAALFAFCLAWVAYPILAVVKAALREAHGEAAQKTLSGDYLADQMAGTRRGLEIAVPHETWDTLAGLAVGAFARLLREGAGDAQRAAYKKHPRRPKKPRPLRQRGDKIKHVATSRLLAAQVRA